MRKVIRNWSATIIAVTIGLAVGTLSTQAKAQQNIFGTAVGSAIGALACSNAGGGSARYQVGAVCATVGGAIGGQWGQQQNSGYYGSAQPIAQMGDDYAAQCAGERYTPDGVYNPTAAQAYCRGRMARRAQEQARYEQEMYNRGLQGR